MNLRPKIAAVLGGTAALLIVGMPISSALGDESEVAIDIPALIAPSLGDSAVLGTSATPLEPGVDTIPAVSPFVRSEPRQVAPFPIMLNKAVQSCVSDYLDQPSNLKLAFERSRPFLPEMVRVMKEQGVPDDLVYLSFAESEFSKRGKGPWQFNAATAKHYGLHVDRWLDERRDPILSTRAAAEYLADLHDKADNDWRVAVVGWNMGEGYLDRYWLLKGANYNKFVNKLPRRTRQLLGRFMAVAFIAHNSAAYGIGPVSYTETPQYRVQSVKGGSLMSEIALKFRTSIAQLRALNPAILRDRVPSYFHAYGIRVPLFQGASPSY